MSVPTGGGRYFKSVFASGDHAYLAGGAAGLHIISVNPPESAEIVKTVPTPGHASGVRVADGYAYVADDAAGLTIIRLNSLQDAEVIASVPTLAPARRVHVAGGYAYLASREAPGGELEIVNVSLPESAYLVSSLPSSGASGVDVSGGYAYIADRNARLRVFDVGEPASAFMTANVSTGPGAWDVDASAGYAYVAARPHLRIFNVADPSSPVLLHWVTSIDAVEVHVEGRYAYVAATNMGLVIVKLF